MKQPKPQFRGLFIGIDRYLADDIQWLSSATRDARALHALFCDTFDVEEKLLIDQGASKDRIERSLDDLASASPEDFVVIAFSGHGSDTHELVVHDTIRSDLPSTGIPLSILEEKLNNIPARHVVCILDCCFSGGFGAKVVHAALRPRGLDSVDPLLERLSGQGRLVLTAATATEEAFESLSFRHGLLTHFLLEALQGCDEVQRGDQLPVYRLLEHVTQRVIDESTRLGKVQHPTLRGLIDGAYSWPVLRPGRRYYEAFPEKGRPTATTDLAGLGSFGFPEALIDRWSQSIPSLNALQVEAINLFGILDQQNVVVSAPTSSGKTMIGELAALNGVLNRGKAIFLLPLKALVNDKQREFTEKYAPFGITTIEATGDTDDITPLLLGRYDIALLTYEKFATIALTFPHVLEQVSVIVVDEVQMITDASRGATLEFVLTLVQSRADEGITPQLICLSAVIGDTHGLERWIGGRLLRRNDRPVPLEEGIVLRNGSYRYLDTTGVERSTAPFIQPMFGKGSSQDWIIPLVKRLVEAGQQVIIFREKKGETRGCAKYLAEHLELPPAETALQRLPQGDRSLASEDLAITLQKGVAFHNADLDREERRIVEEEFRAPNATLRVIVSTTTLAMGINTPASSVIVAGLNHPGPNRTQVPYAVAEYKNLVGRAGRLGFREQGHSYLLALDARTEHDYWSRYVKGKPEDLKSRFLDDRTDMRSLALRVLAATERITGQGMAADAIVAFLESSFGAFEAREQRGTWSWDAGEIRAALQQLAEATLVSLVDGKYKLSELGVLAGQSGLEVESIIRIIASLRSIDKALISDPTLITIAQLTAELDDVLMPLNWKSKHKEPAAWDAELRAQGVPENVLNALSRNARDVSIRTMRAKRAVACLLYITPRPMADVERVLTQFGGAFDGVAGPVRSACSRTCDVLSTIAGIAQIMYPGLDLEERVQRLLVRLDVGVPAELVDLATYARNELSRGNYLALYNAKLTSIETLTATTDEEFGQCFAPRSAPIAVIRAATSRAQKSAVKPGEYKPILEAYAG